MIDAKDENTIFVDVIGGDPQVRQALAWEISEFLLTKELAEVSFTPMNLPNEPREVDSEVTLFDHLMLNNPDLIKKHSAIVIAQEVNPIAFIVEKD